MTPTDFLGNEIRVGQKVARAKSWGRSAVLEVVEVTKIHDDGVVYLDNRKIPVIYTDRLIILK
jgi:predicted component of type VI protein secretion system